jgi:hypothetical protein
MVAKRPIVLRTNTLGSEELRSTDTLSAGGNRLVDVADPEEGTDAVTLDYLAAVIQTASYGISAADIAHWSQAYSWGNHADAGYVPYVGATANVNLGGAYTVTGVIDPVNGSDVVTLDFLTAAISEIIYAADSVTVNTGDNVTGDVTDTQTLSDGNFLEVGEVGGVPGFDIEFDFVSVASFNRIWFHYKYVHTLPAHTIQIRFWNYNTASFDVVTSFANVYDGSYQFLDFVVDDTDHIDGSGNAKVSIYHISSGNTTHEIEIDYIALVKAGYGSSNEHGALLGLADDDHLQYHNDARAAIWYETNYYVIPAGTADPLGATGHWLLAWDNVDEEVEWFWSYELPDFSGATEKDVLRITALNTLEWAARGVDLTSTYMVFVNADTELAGTAKLVFNGTDFTLASGSSLRNVGTLVCAPGGTGAFQLSSTGNARGDYAVDLQMVRDADTQVASGLRAAILSGYGNTVSADLSTVASGKSNSIIAGSTYSLYSCIVAGLNNQVQGETCTIAGGYQNTILLAAGALSSTIVGGTLNSITASYSSICGGYQNSVVPNYSVICCGRENTILVGPYCTITGGYQNVIATAASNNGYNFLGGGTLNSIQGSYCVIGGGYNNDITLAAGVLRGTIAGGRDNVVSSDHGTVGGGRGNTIGSGCTFNTICGGYLNTIPNDCSTYNTISGGYSNTVVAAATNNGSNIICGEDNSIQGKYCGVLSGYSNDITLAAGATYSVICGGSSNDISNDYATIAGGRQNEVTSDYGNVAGGYNHTVSGEYGSIIGGREGTASGVYSSVLGGYLGVAAGENSSVLGRSAKADKYGQSSQAAGIIAASGDAQSSILISRNQTTDATPTELFLNGSDARITIAEATTWLFNVKVVARQTNDDYSVAAYHVEGIISRDTGGNAEIINQASIYANEEDADWDFAISADTGNQSLKLLATGKADNTINWVARIELVEVTG